jgi:hypothetical protein
LAEAGGPLISRRVFAASSPLANQLMNAAASSARWLLAFSDRKLLGAGNVPHLPSFVFRGGRVMSMVWSVRSWKPPLRLGVWMCASAACFLTSGPVGQSPYLA